MAPSRLTGCVFFWEIRTVLSPWRLVFRTHDYAQPRFLEDEFFQRHRPFSPCIGVGVIRGVAALRSYARALARNF